MQYYEILCMNPLIYTTGLFNPGEIGNFLDDDLPKKEHFSSSEGDLAHLHTGAYLPDSHSDLYPLLDWSCPISFTFTRWVEIVLIKVKVIAQGRILSELAVVEKTYLPKVIFITTLIAAAIHVLLFRFKSWMPF